MLKKVLYAGILGVSIGTYFSHRNISFQNPLFNKTYFFVRDMNPQFAHYILKQMISYRFFKKPQVPSNAKINNNNATLKAVGEGFDIQGDMMQGLFDLGFDMVFVGPASYQMIEEEQKKEKGKQVSTQIFPNQFGIKYLKGKFAYFNQNNKNRKQKLGVNIIPSKEVLMYTPYLIKVDLLKSIRIIGQQTDIIVLNFSNEYIKFIPDFDENNKILNQIVSESKILIDQLNKRYQKNIELFIQLDNDKLNTNILENPHINGIILNQSIPNKIESNKIICSNEKINSDVMLVRNQILQLKID